MRKTGSVLIAMVLTMAAGPILARTFGVHTYGAHGATRPNRQRGLHDSAQSRHAGANRDRSALGCRRCGGAA